MMHFLSLCFLVWLACRILGHAIDGAVRDEAKRQREQRP